MRRLTEKMYTKLDLWLTKALLTKYTNKRDDIVKAISKFQLAHLDYTKEINDLREEVKDIQKRLENIK